ncbi:sulfite exporter TauE/SafE family protein [Cryobacterium sp. PH29-G1]|uniref:sulfite exporter TauE/SafE family protein n=1 Tax=Cryobacterium sp. PH29-G1 TaxID=3046211 RepID=UPI0024B9BA3C|nr:sulfite exporter TauE/SafE family protein [Cryobacterium sp. PH29-G1]MDJ0348318.1 sulfite exporter TauE/SafE family protein [Cryobacterium sp. PH29-G1]
MDGRGTADRRPARFVIIAALALGLIVGALLGLVGGGGSILAVPALVYGVGLPLSEAIPSSLIVVGAASAVAVIPRLRRGVNWQLAAIIGAAGVATAYLGAMVNRLIDPRVLLGAFAVIMVIAGVRMFFPTRSVGGPCALPGGGVKWRSCLPRALATGAVVGFLTGLLGVGGGFLIVPALTLVLGLSMSVTIGTSLVIIVINAAAGFTAYLGDVQIDWAVTGAFAATAMVASLAAGRFGRGLPDVVLKRGFAVLVLIIAAYVAVRTVVS